MSSFWWNFHHWLHWKLSLTTSSAASGENFIKMMTFSFQCMPVDIMEDIMRICSTDKKCNLNVLFFHWISIIQPEVNLTKVDKFIIVITKYTYLIFKNLLFSKHKKYLQYVCSPFKFCVGWCSTSKHLPSKYRSNQLLKGTYLHLQSL